MQKHILCLGALALLVSPLRAEAAQPSTDAWFQTTTQALFDAVATGDKHLWSALLDHDCIITNEDGAVMDRQKFLDDLRPLPPGFTGTTKVRDLTVKHFGTAAVVHYWLDETEDIFGQHLATGYVETDTYRKDGHSWKIMAQHTTVVPRDMDPVEVDKSGWDKLAGSYTLSEKTNKRYRVVLREGKLYGGSTAETSTELIPLSPLVFQQKGSIHLMVFVKGQDNNISEVREIHKYNEIRMTRVPE